MSSLASSVSCSVKVEDFQDWQAHRIYNIYTPTKGQPECRSQPVQGNIFVPPVATMVYNGTEPAGANWPVATYRGIGTQAQRDDFHYHTTADAKETPVGFFDLLREVRTYFQTITIVQPTSWPAGTWTAPKNC